jgi:ParB-like chromosome segregation protein Spo0J
MKIIERKAIKVTELKPAEYNPRMMYPDEMQNLIESLKEFGLVEPIVVNKDMTVIGGHQRLRAVIELGWKEVDCNIVDLDKRKEKILNIALNKISGVWDEAKLTDLICELQNDAIGFNEAEVNQYLIRKEIMAEADSRGDADADEELQARFDANERVGLSLEKPEAKVKLNGYAFYAGNMTEYNLIRDFFKSNRKGELDIQQLINLIEQ